ncbi:KTSC domain-containing protein [Rhizobium mesosinicum]|uniref:KTSC domain-containing protein n=1 Tax=Rhizobium mesosinicum TaxID=335017 RepID=A0ABS7H065_9HYPH|nr:KTSC domain-containing protein [Rhizobium mesosinicum]MBW9055654.1 KTSC domain-containing protein [Rhizobium mesosinicum]
MLEKLKNAIGAAEKARRDREISRIGYSEKPSRLVVEFSDGSLRTHVNVLEGHIVGLRIAEDKLSFYESQIEPMNPALEAGGTGAGTGRGASAASAAEQREAQS